MAIRIDQRESDGMEKSLMQNNPHSNAHTKAPMRTLYRNLETQAQIDAQYNPSLLLAPGDQPMEHFTAQANRARSQLRNTLDVSYGLILVAKADLVVKTTLELI